MVATQQVMLEVGIIMLVAFIGAALASKAKQSVIIGYILAGILIGPNLSFEIFGFRYEGIISDLSFISYMSQIGLMMLLFFVGLEFSVSKLKKTKAPAILLAVVNTGLDMFVGILLGLALGWPLVDTIFLAGVVAMGSAAITGKSLMELQKFSNPETEFLLGMVVVEDFLSMVLLTIAGGLVIQSGGVGLGAGNFLGMLVGVAAFYGFFAFLAIWVIPRASKHLQKIRSDELFVLFALGLVFLSCALAEVSGVPAIIGAFFLGMVFAETKVADRIDSKLTSFRDAFVAIFFVLFGMLIDPAMFQSVFWIVLAAVPLVLLSDLLITGALAYLLGFSGRAATSMGAAMCGRGAESVMYASVGSSAVNATKGAELYPFAGAFCFIMSVITPVLMRFSDNIYRVLSRILPQYAKHSGAVISRTLGKIILPSPLRLFKRGRRIEVGLIAFFVLLIAVAVSDSWLHIMLAAVGLAVTIWIFRVLDEELCPIVRSINYDNLNVSSRDGRPISRFISSFVSDSLIMMLAVAFVFLYVWWLSVVVMVVYFFAMLALMKMYSRRMRSPLPFAGVSSAKSVWGFEKPSGPNKGGSDEEVLPGERLRTRMLRGKVKPANGNGNGKKKRRL